MNAEIGHPSNPQLIAEATSSSLLENAQRGDPESRARLYRVYGPLVQNAYLRKVPKQDREDLSHEVFLTVLHKLGGFQKRNGQLPSFRPWLRRIARFKERNYLKRATSRGPGE
jgi:DNA-directed RNA polymerase specialized sigma24 family protein